MSGADRRAKLNRLYWNLRLLGLPAWFHDLSTFAAIGLAAWAVFNVAEKADRTEIKADRTSLKVEQQREGRKVAVEVLCGGLHAVIYAGRIQLVQPIQPPRFRHNLERLGLPRERARSAAAQRAGALYARTISTEIQRQSGVKGIVGKDGNLRCGRLVKASSASP